MSGRILVVENTTIYAEETCRRLSALGYEVMSFPDPETATKLKDVKDDTAQGQTIILSAVQPILERQRFDVITINLHMTDDSDDPLISRGGDGLGEVVLQFVSSRYPGTCCIVCTANPPPRASQVNRYNVFDTVPKLAPPEFIRTLCEAVTEVITEGHPVKRRIGTPDHERDYELKGVDSQIYRFLHNNDIIPQVFSGIADYDNRLIMALAGYPDERVVEATNLMADLWHLEDGLPHYPLIHKLGQMEFGRIFWQNHRDHLVHQLLVYLLGLYLYYGVEYIRVALLNEFKEEASFLRAWKIAALFHDIGYVFEVDIKKRAEVYSEVCGELEKLLELCLHYYFAVRGREKSVLKTEDEKIRAQGKIYFTKLKPTQIDTLSYFGLNEDLFLPLEQQAQKAHLGEAEDNLRRYWRYAMNSTTGKRPGYIDHGITGALVLMQQYRSLKYCVEEAIPVIQRSPHLVSERTGLLINELAKPLAEYQSSVEAAASAIALHYIDVDNWDHDDAFYTQKLTLNQYCLSLRDTPFAFLLALADALQAWDRPKYSMPTGSDLVMQAQDVAIRFRDGKAVIAYRTDLYRGTPQSIFAQMLSQMSHYMHPDDLNALLKEDD